MVWGLMLSHHLLYLLEQIRCEDEFVKFLVCAIHYHGLITFPFLSSFADENDIITNAHYRVHIVGVDDGCHTEFFCNAMKKFIDNE